MAVGYQSEAELENQLIRRLEGLGYGKISIPDVQTLDRHFRDVLNQRNRENLKGKPLSDREFTAALNALIGARTHYQIAEILRGSDIQPYGKIEIQRDDNSKVFLQLFDGTDPKKNIYEVTHQMTIYGRHENRYDVLILINGLPVTQFELKRRGVDFSEAFNQIIRYRSESEKYARLLSLIQMYVISNGNETRYFANGDGQLNSNFMFYWTDKENNWLNDIDAFTASFFDQARFHSLIARYTIFDRVEQKMMIMRPYQIYAAEAILDHAQKNSHKNGYVWHTTGSGKTITSFKASQLLARLTKAEKVIFLIDRADLDEQTARNFAAYLPADVNGQSALDRTSNTRELVRQLVSNDSPLIVSTIQKLNNAVQNDKYKKELTPYHNRKVVFIEDEAHRSQFGDMRKNVNRWFQNSQHFGFTGTPIFKENTGIDGRTTADLYDQLLHKYLIKDAIRDHNVLGFTVQYIQTFQGKNIINDDGELVKGIDQASVFEAPERMTNIVNHIINKHAQFTKLKHYNAIFTVSSTRQALAYYDLFKKLDPNHRLNVTTIFTWQANEVDNEVHQGQDDVTSRQGLDKVINDYNKRYHTDFSTDHFSEYFKDVSKRMKAHNDATPDENIDVLIVVNMFLTGFDSKRLSTLYVDKKLRWQGLIQAFSRTNRIDTNNKPFGNIICYRNLKEATDDAVALYSDGDQQAFFAPSYPELKSQFISAIQALHLVTPTKDDVDPLYNQGDEALEKFVLAFRSVLRVFNKVRVYDEFDWGQFKNIFTNQDFEDFKGKYYTAYKRLKPENSIEKADILDDIDFDMTLVQTDTIDVAYIVNLIKSINLDDDKSRNSDVEKIQRILNNATDDHLRSKAELLKRFLDENVPKLNSKSDIGNELNKFLADSRENALVGFSKNHKLPLSVVKEQLSDYNFTGRANLQSMQKEFNDLGLGFHEKRKLSAEMKQLLENVSEKYSLS